MDIDDIFKVAQTYLDKPPLVIWGSGATIDFGLPSMSQLKDEIGLSDVLNKAADLPHLTPEACRELLPDKWTKG